MQIIRAGAHSRGASRLDNGDLALRLVVEEALEREIGDIFGRERYERGEGEKARSKEDVETDGFPAVVPFSKAQATPEFKVTAAYNTWIRDRSRNAFVGHTEPVTRLRKSPIPAIWVLIRGGGIRECRLE